MNILTVSGCDSVVQSAVVEEKDKADQTKMEKKKIIQKTVAEQVQAPETYQTMIKSDLKSEDRSDKENPMKFTLIADASVEVPDVDVICLKKVKKVEISEEEQEKVKDILGKGQSMQEIWPVRRVPIENVQNGMYTVDGLTYRYTYVQGNQEELKFQTEGAFFDDSGDMVLASSEKKKREERFQNYIKAGKGKMTEKEARDKVTNLISGEWEVYDSSSKELIGENISLEKDDFIFERIIDGIPVNYVRSSCLPIGNLSSTLKEKDGAAYEEQSEGWDNEVLTADFCSGTIQNFLHTNPIEVSDASDEPLFLLPFDEIRDIFEKTITLQVMTEQKDRLIAVDGQSQYRYPSIDAQSAEMTVTKVQLGYMRVRDDKSDMEGSLIPVWDFYGTWTSKEPEYEYEMGDEAVMGNVSMDAAGVPFLTIDACDGSVVQRTQAG